MPALIASFLNLFGDGPLAMCSISRTRKRLVSLRDTYPEVYRDLGYTWVPFRMRLPNYGTGYLLRNKILMPILQRSGPIGNLQSISKLSVYSFIHSDVPSPIPLFRMANAGYRRRIVRDFQTQLYRTCRIHSTILVAYEDEDGNVRASMYVIGSIIR